MSENTEAPEGGAAPEVNETEQRAREQGWVPKDEWQGDGKWRDAEAFLDRGELFQKIDAQRREVRELRKTQEAFNAHIETVRKAEYNRALATVRAEKKAALESGDPDALIQADDKLVALQIETAKQAQADARAQATGNPPVEFDTWKQRNTWYTNDDIMKTYADTKGLEMAHSGMEPNEVLKEVELLVRRKFPEKFTNPNRSRPGAVEAGAGKGTTAKADSYSLSDEERGVMNRLVKSGIMTKDDYIRDLKAAKER